MKIFDVIELLDVCSCWNCIFDFDERYGEDGKESIPAGTEELNILELQHYVSDKGVVVVGDKGGDVRGDNDDNGGVEDGEGVAEVFIPTEVWMDCGLSFE